MNGCRFACSTHWGGGTFGKDIPLLSCLEIERVIFITAIGSDVGLGYTRKFLTYLTASWPLSFAATSASAAERRARVLPMNQWSDGLQSSE
jgi:hypothetical protein